jgi:hypothetical protein
LLAVSSVKCRFTLFGALIVENVIGCLPLLRYRHHCGAPAIAG